MNSLATWGATLLPSLLLLLLKSTLVAALALFGAWFLRRASSAERHAILAFGTVALLALPLAGAIAPRWHLPLVEAPSALAAEAASGHSGAAPLQRAQQADTPLASLWVLAGWGVISLALAGTLLGSKIAGRRHLERGSVDSDAALEAEAAELAQRLGLRAVPVRLCPAVSIPLVAGTFRPRILLPPGARSWPSPCREAVLLHELAHVKRRDVLVQTLAQLACCAFWPNPLAWVLERRLFLERERAADDVALGLGVDPADFAERLLAMLERTRAERGRLWVGTAMAEGSDFKERILSLLNPAARRRGARKAFLAALAAVACIVLVPLAPLSPWAVLGDPLPRQGDSGPTSDGAITALCAALDDPDPSVRRQAAVWLGRHASPEGVPRLERALFDETDDDVRTAVAHALGRTGGAQALSALKRSLAEDPCPSVRERAAYWIGRHGD